MRDPLYASRLPADYKGDPPYTARANTALQGLMQHYLEQMVGVMGIGKKNSAVDEDEAETQGRNCGRFPWRSPMNDEQES